jgi:electron transfer flavoprotein alpha subunit
MENKNAITENVLSTGELLVKAIAAVIRGEDFEFPQGTDFEKLYKLAEQLGAEIGASRGLVDMNKMSYDKQIGLTGKTVSPKIYIAIGISGAIHHTCAIEESTTVIAINPDKDARIFDYADYGIVDKIENVII